MTASTSPSVPNVFASVIVKLMTPAGAASIFGLTRFVTSAQWFHDEMLLNGEMLQVTGEPSTRMSPLFSLSPENPVVAAAKKAFLVVAPDCFCTRLYPVANV